MAADPTTAVEVARPRIHVRNAQKSFAGRVVVVDPVEDGVGDGFEACQGP